MDDAVKQQIKSRELPTGFKCKCGKVHTYHPYVYAHWREPLVMTCPECGRKWQVMMGHVKLIGAKQ